MKKYITFFFCLAVIATGNAPDLVIETALFVLIPYVYEEINSSLVL
jgi:hypothetical protein